MKKMLLIVALLVVMLLPAFSAADTRLVAVETELNARAEPSAEAERLFVLWNNCVVEVLEEKDGWAYITWWQMPDKPAWVCAEYLTEVKP